ncbi:MAG: glucose 1-dehydrogenase [SAR202 cluster bacterium]|nr:glucose 1-dehydrogenase [SAR202 cluster bacterium]
MRLAGKVALITGGAGEMGQAKAKLFAVEGAAVAVADIIEAAGEAVVRDIRQAGGKAMFVKLDVSSETDWAAAVANVEKRFGKLDVLVNNAGIYQTTQVESTSVEEWDRTMAVNARGVFLGVKHVIPAMRRARGGSIVNISSTTGIVGGTRGSAYGASKGAVRAFTKFAAIQLAKDGIRVNSIHPGPIDTPLIAVNIGTPEGRAASVSRVPLGRIGTPADVAYGALYLASDESSFVTGSELVIDGGLTAQ